jgi:hypothetical protein
VEGDVNGCVSQGDFLVDGIAIVKNALLGLPCTSVNKAEYSWHLSFGHGEATLNLECPWRLSSDGAIAYGYEDDGQQFGLSHPVDGVAKSTALLMNSLVASVEIDEISSDLSITFSNGVGLEIFNASSGYEGWNCSLTNGTTVVAKGGGNLYVWSPVAGNQGKK